MIRRYRGARHLSASASGTDSDDTNLLLVSPGVMRMATRHGYLAAQLDHSKEADPSGSGLLLFARPLGEDLGRVDPLGAGRDHLSVWATPLGN